ncbi:helix-turn-helix transcriptional regulator [Ignatzschineria larvae DSM 13226]|uniref:Helix-turn-helix transcriptional regulator n=1 Tax=Ignatzschineria larvae DSM 13226 TaxID=1111732 RepID=A0ABZ3C090_9GAMM|nr:helix-turn-helix transcriptional regulator [Ignatzschineria larvae]
MLIQQFRQALQYSQETLAKELQLSVIDIENWESGTAFPEIRDLRDMALLFKTSVEELRGDYPLRAYPRTGHFFVNNSTIDAFWGHICIHLQSHENALWFPISLKSQQSAAKQLTQSSTIHPWISIETLNNRLLFINVMHTDSVELIHQQKEDQQSASNDWDIQGYSLELYRALMHKDQDPFGYMASDQYSDGFREKVESICHYHEIYIGAQLPDLLYNTHIIQVQNNITNPIAPHFIAEIYQNIRDQQMPIMLNISKSIESNQHFIQSTKIALINTPLALLIDYQVSQKTEAC